MTKLENCVTVLVQQHSFIVFGGVLMKWKADKGRPLCPQIYEQICVRIASGEYKPNQKLISVREMAVASGVNPNTVQRSFEMLEQSGIIYSIPASGWYVSEDTKIAQNTLNELAMKKMKSFFEEMQSLGLDFASIKKLVEEWENE